MRCMEVTGCVDVDKFGVVVIEGVGLWGCFGQIVWAYKYSVLSF